MKKLLTLIIFSLITILELEGFESADYPDLSDLINKLEQVSYSNKSKVEILCIFFNELSSTFDLDLDVTSSNSVLKISHNEVVNTFNCKNDISNVLDQLDLYSDKIDSVLNQNHINSELELYLCDFLISKIESSTNSRVVPSDYIRKYDKQFGFYYNKNIKNEYEISWIKNFKCASIDTTIRIGDIIQSINNIPAKYLTNNIVQSFLDNDSIDLVLKSGNTLKKCRAISYKNDSFEPYQISKIDTNTVYLKINSFFRRDSWNISEDLRKNSFERIIIDLRNNTGGYFEDIAMFIGLFINLNDTITILKTPHKLLEKAYLSPLYNSFEKPEILILINNSTSSGANIIPGVLKTSRNAIIIGEESYGETSIHNAYILHSKIFKANIMVAKFSLSTAAPSLENGIKPDFYIKDCINSKMDNVLNFAVNFKN